MWIETFIHKEKKGTIDIPALAAGRGLSFGTLNRDRVLVPDITGERTVIFDRMFPGMAIDLKQDEATAELRLNFPAGTYDIGLYFDLIQDVCDLSDTDTFYIEASELGTEEIDELQDYFESASIEIIKILTSQLREHKVTGLIVLGSRNPFVIGAKQAEEIGEDIDKFALMINNAQRIKALYCCHWSYIGGYRNICVYEAPPGERSIIPLHPAPFLGGNMPSKCEYYVDVPGVSFFRYEDFMKQYRNTAQRYDGACILVEPGEEELSDMRYSMGIDILSGNNSQRRSMGRFVDWGEYHYGKVRRKHLATEEINCYSHLAVYLEWCFRKGLLNDDFLRDYPDLPRVIGDPSDDLREYMRYSMANGGALGPCMFTEEGRRFTESYYLFGKNGYASHVDATAEEIFGHERYHCDEFKGEAYLFLEYNDEYRSLLSEKIEASWYSFLKGDPAAKDSLDLNDRRMF